MIPSSPTPPRAPRARKRVKPTSPPAERSLLDYPVHIQRALAMHEVIRRCGVELDAIYVSAVGGLLAVLIGPSYGFPIAKLNAEEVEAFPRLWPEAVRAWNENAGGGRQAVWTDFINGLSHNEQVRLVLGVNAVVTAYAAEPVS